MSLVARLPTVTLSQTASTLDQHWEIKRNLEKNKSGTQGDQTARECSEQSVCSLLLLANTSG